MSNIYLGLYFLENVNASHKTNLPSASVFSISIVIPDMLVTTSPGRVATPLGIFSAQASMPITLFFKFISAHACIVPITEPAPDISYFISSIFGDGFRDMPPVSNVIPLPTNTIGCLFFIGIYLIITSFAGCVLPCETDSKDPILRVRICFSSRTSTFKFLFNFSNFFASFAKKVGLHIFGGVSPRILALLRPLAIAIEISMVLFNCLLLILFEMFNKHFFKDEVFVFL